MTRFAIALIVSGLNHSLISKAEEPTARHIFCGNKHPAHGSRNEYAFMANDVVAWDVLRPRDYAARTPSFVEAAR